MNKQKANIILALAFLVFSLAVAVKYYYPAGFWARLLLTVAEASLVGGIADWFAVTALFRKPLGFPYHTALIPRNRQRIIAALANAVERDFLSKESIKARLEKARVMEWIIKQADSRRTGVRLRRFISQIVEEAIATINPAVVGKYLNQAIKNALKSQPIATYAAAGARWAQGEDKDRLLYEAILDELIELVRDSKTREAIFFYLEGIKQKEANKTWLASVLTGVMEQTDSLNLVDAAIALQNEIIIALAEMRVEQNHPIWLWFREELTVVVENLETNENWIAATDLWKDGVLNRIDLSEPLAAAAASALHSLGGSQTAAPAGSVSRGDSRQFIVDSIMTEIEKYWEKFKNNRKMMNQVETYIRELILQIVDNEHHLIGEAVQTALNRLTDEDLNYFIEDKAGDDLQWIRINGVVVGAVVGLFLTLFLHFIYDPYLVPTIRQLVEIRL
ncbi:MAG TPA: DUF445 domain-containing protein [Methylomusa anaerophila]|uniref:DUF445 domain-containing protein n=1 Tax=Methylomusa anaerophila TaxID=1930071 RepID=A0A348AIG6_9FIRM|nr:DUF445 domain-containing protein [Methylomusa anaerophila]BBB90864.1 hypothetical protein MAMMFC1_01531 [Methylomusa anaerophila]HML90657.1 DUF445 domain-containing protein [Methylomusa anaerophila]